MLISTKAIVISKLKYSDNDLIVKCYTEKFGIQSYLLRGVLKRKKSKIKAAYFHVLSQLDLVVNYRENRSLHSINDVKPLYIYDSIHTNISKAAIAMFLAEVLSSILKEEEQNIVLYKYLETTLLWLDANDEIPNFHLLFLLNLTKHLGFYPDLAQSSLDYFNLEDGKFQIKKTNNFCVYGENLIVLKQLLGIHFDALNTVSVNSKKRQEFLNMILLYFELHLGTLKKPKSLQVLNQVFS